MTAPTTRAERVAAVDDIVRRRTVTLGPNTPSEIAKEIDAYYHPRTLRPVQTALGVVTYDPTRPENPWALKYPNGHTRYEKHLSFMRPMMLADADYCLTDDEIERCLELRKQPWEE